MGQEELSIGHTEVSQRTSYTSKDTRAEDFVLEKNIFSNIFEKDIRRVFIYKKAERLAKAIHLITPAFAEAVSLRNRVDAIAVGLIDAAILPPSGARAALSHELLALSSVLSIARTGGLLSAMNADLIAHEAQSLLQEVAAYEDPRVFLDEAPTLAGIAKQAALSQHAAPRAAAPRPSSPKVPAARPTERVEAKVKDISKGQAPEQTAVKDREAAVLSIIREKGEASIKDISMRFRDISEKTIQRELASLVLRGRVAKRGERRWSTYSII